MERQLKAAVFLDRDGTINVDRGYLHRIEDFEYLEGAVEGLKSLQSMGYLLVVITNQSGIARGYYTEQDFLKLNKWMMEDLRHQGITISGAYYCPHYPQGKIRKYSIECNCRKPQIGLYLKAQREFGIDFSASIAIGDKYRDLHICEETEVKGILLSEELKPELPNIYSCANWNAAIKLIYSWQKADRDSGAAKNVKENNKTNGNRLNSV